MVTVQSLYEHEITFNRNQNLKIQNILIVFVYQIKGPYSESIVIDCHQVYVTLAIWGNLVCHSNMSQQISIQSFISEVSNRYSDKEIFVTKHFDMEANKWRTR